MQHGKVSARLLLVFPRVFVVVIVISLLISITQQLSMKQLSPAFFPPELQTWNRSFKRQRVSCRLRVREAPAANSCLSSSLFCLVATPKSANNKGMAKRLLFTSSHFAGKAQPPPPKLPPDEARKLLLSVR